MKRLITLLAAGLAACGSTGEPDSTQDPLEEQAQVEETENDEPGVPAKTDPDDATEPEVPTTPGDPVDAVPDDGALHLSEFHADVFVEKGCTSGYCHAGFQLGAAEAVIAAFVDVEAPQPTCGRTHYIVPGDPEQSILWVRVRPITDEDRECEVVKMPASSTDGLDADSAQLIYDWIADGALL